MPLLSPGGSIGQGFISEDAGRTATEAAVAYRPTGGRNGSFGRRRRSMAAILLGAGGRRAYSRLGRAHGRWPHSDVGQSRRHAVAPRRKTTYQRPRSYDRAVHAVIRRRGLSHAHFRHARR